MLRDKSMSKLPILITLVILTVSLVLTSSALAQETEGGSGGLGEVDLQTQPYITFDRELTDPPAANKPIRTKVYLENIGKKDAKNVKLVMGDIGHLYESETLYGESAYNQKVQFEFSDVQGAQLESKKVIKFEGPLNTGEKHTISFAITIKSEADKTIPVYLEWEDREGELYKNMMNQITYYVASAKALSGEGITGEGGYLGKLGKASDSGGWESPFWPSQKEAPELKIPGFHAPLAILGLLGSLFILSRLRRD